jgi:hypothetical protein
MMLYLVKKMGKSGRKIFGRAVELYDVLQCLLTMRMALVRTLCAILLIGMHIEFLKKRDGHVAAPEAAGGKGVLAVD